MGKSAKVGIDNPQAEEERKNRLQEKLKTIDVSLIKKPGYLTAPVGRIPRLIRFFSNFNPAEELQLMEATIDSEELNDNYQGIYATGSVIGGLVVAFCFTATQTRLSPTEENILTIFLSHQQNSFIVDVYGLLIALAMVMGIFLIFYGTFISTMLSQIPKDLTQKYFTTGGGFYFQFVFVLQTLCLICLLLAIVLQVALNYALWVVVIMAVSTAAFGLFMWFSFLSMQNIRMELLRGRFEEMTTK